MAENPRGTARVSLPVLREPWLFALAALGSLALAWPRVARDLVLFGDAAELSAAAHVWGVPRAPGYPLWSTLAHVATKLPFGAEAFRVNLSSALFHALAVGAAACAAQRFSRALAGGLCAAACLALSRSFHLGSLYAEVFPLGDALFALGLWLGARAGEGPAGAARRELVALAIVVGLGLAHHELFLLGVPALLILARRAIHGRGRLAAELGVVAALSFLGSQGLLWLVARRAPPVLGSDLGSLTGFWHTLARTEWGGPFGAARLTGSEPADERVGAFVLLLFESLGPVALAVAVVGALRLLRERRDGCVALLLGFALPGPVLPLALGFSVDGEVALAQFERWTTMAHIPLAVLAGVGVMAPLGLVPADLPRRALVGLAAAFVPALPLATKALDLDLSRERIGGSFARDLLHGVPEGSLVLVSGDLYLGAAAYACAVERRCTRVNVVAPGLLAQPWRRALHERASPEVVLPEGRMLLGRSHQLVAGELPKRAVFLSPSVIARDPEIERRFRIRPEGLLARVYAGEASDVRSVELATALAAGRELEVAAIDPRNVFRPSQHVQVLMAYSALIENLSRLALRVGAEEPGRKLGVRYRAFDSVVGAQLTVSGGGASP